ncbi:signal peptidase I [Fundicoccus sp. Sow4_D5]|uniref:signal peptidase I n=1 Tax=unclassified Fundicoccus TaxID=2761543 RepID=UPI003F8DCD36
MINFLKTVIIETVNVVFAVLFAVIIFLVMRAFVVQPFQVEGTSMNNTLENGQQMLMFKMTELERFDIVVFPDPRGSQDSYVKRIIGLPGDTLYYEEDQLILNNQIVDEPYLEPLKEASQENFTQNFNLWDNLGVTSVPEGYYFVLGDNRPYSGDSRQFGFVPIDSVIGEANFVYFPFNEFGLLPSYTLNDVGQLVTD